MSKIKDSFEISIHHLHTFKSALIALLITAASTGYSQTREAKIFTDFKKNGLKSILPDFSYAGYANGERQVPRLTNNVINVADFNIFPDGHDQTDKVQGLISRIGANGGGVLYFPKGKYLFNMNAEKTNFLKINYSNVVIRGAGSGPDGTVFYNGNNTLQEEISSWISPFLIQTGYDIEGTESFWGLDFPDPKRTTMMSKSGNNGVINEAINKAEVTTKITKDILKGSQVIAVQSSQALKAGDCILIGMFNTTEEGNLIHDLLAPIKEFDRGETVAQKAGAFRSPSYQWLVQVDNIIDGHHIRLKQPLRRDIRTIYQPVIARAAMLHDIGVEDLSIESAWDGHYCHHGCNKTDSHEVRIMDYGWNAINFCRVSNGWISNVVINNFTNGIYLLDSRNVTVQNVKFGGYDGHSGIKVYCHAEDNLIRNIEFTCNFTHVIGGEGNAYGNVFSHINYHSDRNIPGHFDSHGFSDRRFSPPAQNLFEDISGMEKISGGGSVQNLPHMAEFNTWWNVSEGKFGPDAELFHSWYYESLKSAHPQSDHYKLYLRSIVVGVNSPFQKLTIGGMTADQSNEWIYTENFNKGYVKPYSLYEAQLSLRKRQH